MDPRRVLPLLLAGSLWPASSSAQSVTVETIVPFPADGVSTTLVVPRFDAGLGRLLRIEAAAYATGAATLSVENQGLQSPNHVHGTLERGCQLLWSDGSEFLDAELSAPFDATLAPFDGVVDYAGASGAVLGPVNVWFTATAQWMAPSARTAPFDEGPGDVTFQCVGRSESHLTGDAPWAELTDCPADLWLVLQYLYRPHFETLCAGDGIGAPCPCGNTGGPGRGCGNSADPGGARLRAEGRPDVGADSVRFQVEGLPGSTPCLFLQGTEGAGAGGWMGVPFGDGLLCVGGSLLRLGRAQAIGGAAEFPPEGTPGIALRGGAVGRPGTSFVYQVHYRNCADFCTPATFNTSNGLIVNWY